MITDNQLVMGVRRQPTGKERMYKVIIAPIDSPTVWINVPAQTKIDAGFFAKEYAIRILGLPNRGFTTWTERVEE